MSHNPSWLNNVLVCQWLVWLSLAQDLYLCFPPSALCGSIELWHRIWPSHIIQLGDDKKHPLTMINCFHFMIIISAIILYIVYAGYKQNISHLHYRMKLWLFYDSDNNIFTLNYRIILINYLSSDYRTCAEYTMNIYYVIWWFLCID